MNGRRALATMVLAGLSLAHTAASACFEEFSAVNTRLRGSSRASRFSLVFCSLVGAHGLSLAGSAYTGKLSSVVCHATVVGGACQVSLVGTPTGETCSSSGWKYTFNGTTPEGKNLLAILLAAQVAQRDVALGGLGVCTLAGGSEDLRHAYIVP
jgi:hypothetical protein